MRHEADFRGHGAGAAIAAKPDILPEGDGAQGGFRHVEARFDVAGRQERRDRAAGGDPFALDEEGVLHEPAYGRGDALLFQAPRRLRERGARGRHLALGGAALGLAAERLKRAAELCLHLGEAREVALVQRAHFVEARLRDSLWLAYATPIELGTSLHRGKSAEHGLFVGARRTRIDALAEEGNTRAKLARKGMRKAVLSLTRPKGKVRLKGPRPHDDDGLPIILQLGHYRDELARWDAHFR